LQKDASRLRSSDLLVLRTQPFCRAYSAGLRALAAARSF
jgi:hypothetical protein